MLAVLLRSLFYLLVIVLHFSSIGKEHLGAALLDVLTLFVLLFFFRLRRLSQPMTLWSQSWLRSCHTSVKEPVTRRWRRRTKVTQHFLCHQNKETLLRSAWELVLIGTVSGKLDEKRAPEADLRSVSSNTSQYTTTAVSTNEAHNFCLCAQYLRWCRRLHRVHKLLLLQAFERQRETQREGQGWRQQESQTHSQLLWEAARRWTPGCTTHSQKTKCHESCFWGGSELVSVFLFVNRQWKLIQVTYL